MLIKFVGLCFIPVRMLGWHCTRCCTGICVMVPPQMCCRLELAGKLNTASPGEWDFLQNWWEVAVKQITCLPSVCSLHAWMVCSGSAHALENMGWDAVVRSVQAGGNTTSGSRVSSLNWALSFSLPWLWFRRTLLVFLSPAASLQKHQDWWY